MSRAGLIPDSAAVGLFDATSISEVFSVIHQSDQALAPRSHPGQKKF
jgi:hypothetical protein